MKSSSASASGSVWVSLLETEYEDPKGVIYCSDLLLGHSSSMIVVIMVVAVHNDNVAWPVGNVWHYMCLGSGHGTSTALQPATCLEDVLPSSEMVSPSQLMQQPFVKEDITILLDKSFTVWYYSIPHDDFGS